MPAAASSASWAPMDLLRDSSVLPVLTLSLSHLLNQDGENHSGCVAESRLNLNPRDLMHLAVFLGQARSGQESATDTQTFTPA